MKDSVRAFGAGLVALCLTLGSASASVVVGGTRVVFPGDKGETTLRLNNEGDEPALVQSWIDRGDPKSTPDKVDVPFLITPPLFRMDAHKGQSLRIVYTQEALPADRESLFWLNVLEVPPKPTGERANANILQFAVRTRIKLFYRPANLNVDPAKAPEQLTWKVVADGQGNALQVTNPTPYYITFSEVTVVAGGKTLTVDSGMVDPKGTLKLSMPGLTALPAGTAVTFSTINDFGAASNFKGEVRS
ncbi:MULTISPECIES: fimbrial biogenesis chaperone [Dyella]|uniref:Molecular chaperone n=2 Tax=Dyella TaxID=231454 RepID=A0A4R0YKB5_9GAMM|nr:MULTISPECIES: fimbria/pilus periplasmic chaperone [Dyella]TBR36234.1 molecular chaperone [Dyella terrae]TCI05891.1 molecular chaperone [Dyella soli]